MQGDELPICPRCGRPVAAPMIEGRVVGPHTRYCIKCLSQAAEAGSDAELIAPVGRELWGRLARPEVWECVAGPLVDVPACTCREHGPVVRDGRCLVCLWKREVDGSPPVERDQLSMLLVRWRLPPETPLHVLVGDAGELDKRWKGYRTTIWLMPPLSDARWRIFPSADGRARFTAAYQTTADREVPSAPADPAEVETAGHAVLRFHLWRPPSPGAKRRRGAQEYLAGWWDPGQQRPCWSLWDVDPRIPSATLGQWSQLLPGLTRLGRTPGSGYFSGLDHFRSDCAKALAGLPRGQQPTNAWLAAALGVSESTIVRARRRYKVDPRTLPR